MGTATCVNAGVNTVPNCDAFDANDVVGNWNLPAPAPTGITCPLDGYWAERGNNINVNSIFLEIRSEKTDATTVQECWDAPQKVKLFFAGGTNQQALDMFTGTASLTFGNWMAYFQEASGTSGVHRGGITTAMHPRINMYLNSWGYSLNDMQTELYDYVMTLRLDLQDIGPPTTQINGHGVHDGNLYPVDPSIIEQFSFMTPAT